MELLTASIKENLWHKLRQDLQSYVPQIRDNDVLMCCACGRLLPYDDFNLEHIIPLQALADDPAEVKTNPETTASVRAGNMLLCSKRLTINGNRFYNNGCNSWKGRHYDGRLRELLSGRIFDHEHKQVSNQHIIAAICAAYLAMVLEFGYQIALTPSGLLMRHQFFSPSKFHQGMPLKNQMILAAPPPEYDESHLRIWAHPFSFTIERDSCYVGFRTMSLIMPISRDPRLPVARSMLITPPKYKLRPDFRTVFD